MIIGAPLAGAPAMAFFHAVHVSVAVTTNGSSVGHCTSVGGRIAATGGVTAAGVFEGGKLELGDVRSELVVGCNELCVGGDKSRIVCDELV